MKQSTIKTQSNEGQLHVEKISSKEYEKISSFVTIEKLTSTTKFSTKQFIIEIIEFVSTEKIESSESENTKLYSLILSQFDKNSSNDDQNQKIYLYKLLTTNDLSQIQEKFSAYSRIVLMLLTVFDGEIQNFNDSSKNLKGFIEFYERNLEKEEKKEFGLTEIVSYANCSVDFQQSYLNNLRKIAEAAYKDGEEDEDNFWYDTITLDQSSTTDNNKTTKIILQQHSQPFQRGAAFKLVNKFLGNFCMAVKTDKSSWGLGTKQNRSKIEDQKSIFQSLLQLQKYGYLKNGIFEIDQSSNNSNRNIFFDLVDITLESGSFDIFDFFMKSAAEILGSEYSTEKLNIAMEHVDSDGHTILDYCFQHLIHVTEDNSSTSYSKISQGASSPCFHDNSNLTMEEMIELSYNNTATSTPTSKLEPERKKSNSRIFSSSGARKNKKDQINKQKLLLQIACKLIDCGSPLYFPDNPYNPKQPIFTFIQSDLADIKKGSSNSDEIQELKNKIRDQLNHKLNAEPSSFDKLIDLKNGNSLFHVTRNLGVLTYLVDDLNININQQNFNGKTAIQLIVEELAYKRRGTMDENSIFSNKDKISTDSYSDDEILKDSNNTSNSKSNKKGTTAKPKISQEEQERLDELEALDKLVHFFIINNSDLNIIDNEDCSPLYSCITNQDKKLIKKLLCFGANVKISDKVYNSIHTLPAEQQKYLFGEEWSSPNAAEKVSESSDTSQTGSLFETAQSGSLESPRSPLNKDFQMKSLSLSHGHKSQKLHQVMHRHPSVETFRKSLSFMQEDNVNWTNPNNLQGKPNSLNSTRSENNNNNNHPDKINIRVLTLDGGGIRGIILAKILDALEKVAKKEIYKLFDLIAGTSTGSILAMMLCRKGTPAESLRMYFKLKDQIFTGKKPYNCQKLEHFYRGWLVKKKLLI